MFDLQRSPPVDLDRRTVLGLLGLGAGVAACASATRGSASSASTGVRPWVHADGAPSWVPPRLPLPSYGDGGSAATDPGRFARYAVSDELVLPEGFRYEVLARWGDPLGNSGARFGHNADFTALVPIAGSEDEFFLVVNHEYISARPWLQGYSAAHGVDLPRLRLVLAAEPAGGVVLEVDGQRLDTAAVDLTAPDVETRLGTRSVQALRELSRAALDDLGVSVVHVRRRPDGGFETVPGSQCCARISALHPSTPTLGNCSGGVTPWGTVLTCEENYQDEVRDEVDAQGRLVEARPMPFGFFGHLPGLDEPQELRALGQGLATPLDGRDFGWVCELDPARGTLRKLPRLGRFRHENAGIRCVRGEPLVVYQGDDRRGGHVWKYVSRDVVRDPADPRNAALLDEGTLLVARFEPDGSGCWIPLEPGTPLARPQPQDTAGGHLWLPDRRTPSAGRVVVHTPGASLQGLSPKAWVTSLEDACARPFDALTLGDLVAPPDERPDLSGAALERHRRRVLLLEAFAMANAVGGTPTARPEDIELHPVDGSLYVAFTDATGSADGSPDRRVFPDSDQQSSRQYGGILRLEEQDTAAGASFRWSRFLSSGELWEGGGAFACADNLVFDPSGNLWITCDLSTDRHNAAVDRASPGCRPGQPAFAGVFGNNALFMVPTAGPDAGKPVCFAIGPMECELTGPTFSPDGRALILSVQHPGEIHGTRGRPGASLPDSVERMLTIAARDGQPFPQRRSVPLGSNFPSAQLGVPPRPCVVCITRVE